MLRFFRTIRKKLIDEDSFRKYLLYVAENIILVVIENTCPVRDCLSVEKEIKTKPLYR